ncbi:MAG: Lrp/AsnC family transcriptional regulator [Hyphomicrobiaceae bacterium]|nr:Lrp/AsnC family transcriptional regulator [Hyphomicrobiaceae bacterium]
MHAPAIERSADASGIDSALINEWQRGLPLVSRPFATIALALGTGEENVIARLKALQARGAIARVGGVVRPNTLGASTLAALAAPELRVDEVARRLAEIPGINHIYLRENARNLWFVVTGPDRDYVDAALRRIESETGLAVLDLRLERAYHIDLGFTMNRPQERRYHNAGSARPRPEIACDAIDRAIAQTMTIGLPLTSRPFKEAGRTIGLSEETMIRRVQRLADAEILPRIGVIVRHRALGWRANAMVVFDIADDRIEAAGTALSQAPGINLCYRRTRYAESWPFNLYCMVHARSRDEAFATLERAVGQAELATVQKEILFSLHCFKQTGALITAPEAA